MVNLVKRICEFLHGTKNDEVAELRSLVEEYRQLLTLTKENSSLKQDILFRALEENRRVQANPPGVM
jgi:hypothetical protein